MTFTHCAPSHSISLFCLFSLSILFLHIFLLFLLPYLHLLSLLQLYLLPFFIFAVIFPLEGRTPNNWSVLFTSLLSSHPLSYYNFWCILFSLLPSYMPSSPSLFPLFHTITAWLITTLPHLLLTKAKQVYLSHSPGNNLKAKMTEIYSERLRRLWPAGLLHGPLPSTLPVSNVCLMVHVMTRTSAISIPLIA